VRQVLTVGLPQERAPWWGLVLSYQDHVVY